MTLLFGDDNFTDWSGPGPVLTDGGYLPARSFIATQSGKVTNLNCWLQPGSVTDSFVLALYDNTLQLIAASAPVTPGLVSGIVSFPITPTSVFALRAYQIVLLSNSVAFQFGTDGSIPTRAYKVANAASLYPAAVFALQGPTPTTFNAPVFYADGDAQAALLSTSSTNGQTLFDTATVITRAFNRCRIRSAILSDEMIREALDELFLILVDIANGPTPLWSIDFLLQPFSAGTSAIGLPEGTIEVKDVNYRQMNPLQSGALSYAPATPTQVTTVAVTWNGPAVPIQIQMGQDGINWLTLVTATPNASAGQTTLYDLDGTVPANFYQVVPVDQTEESNIGSVTFYQILTEIPMAPYSRDQWTQLPSKFFSGTPRQYWFERTVDPILHFWPVPRIADQTNACAVIWRQRQIQDVGDLTQKVECPQRWLPYIIDALAVSLNRTQATADLALLPINQQFMEKSHLLAKGEERERGPMKIQPNIARYTR